jgi:hypothetical protein
MFLAPISFVLLWAPGRARAAIHVLAASVILVSIHAIFEVRSVLLSGLSLESNRATGLVGNQPNLFGGFLAMMLAIFIIPARAVQGKAVVRCDGRIGNGAPFTLSRRIRFHRINARRRLVVFSLSREPLVVTGACSRVADDVREGGQAPL